MTVEAGVERLAALAFLIIGVSHVAAPRVWARFFIDMRERGETAGFLNAWVHMPLGLLIVAFHPVWTGPALVVTLVGWALTLKGALYFTFPRVALASMARVTEERAGQFRIAGAVSLLLGLAIGWIALASPGA